MSIDHDVLLLPVFQEMRRLGADVSMAEYLQAIQMLRSGVGLESASQLAQTCRLLWARSRAEQEMFDTAFAEKAAPKLAILVAPLVPETEKADPVYDDYPLSEEEEQPAPQPAITSYQQEFPLAPSPALNFPTSSPAPTYIPSKRIYHFTSRLPLSKSEMSGHWRQLRRIQPVGSVKELDIAATIHDICQQGTFRGPIMRPAAGNTTRLLLLVDQGGSMTPFKMLTEALLTSVTRDSLPGRTMLYYFHDYPGRTLYEDAQLGQPLALEQVLTHSAHNSAVLIVSDAGAARAHYDDERVQKTWQFLKLLRHYTYLYAWLNPLPFARWRSTTAEDIEQLVPMFPLDRDGLDDAITILRGYPFPPGVSTYV